MRIEYNGSSQKYTTVKDNYDDNIQNHHCLHINRLDARSVIIPALKKNIYYKNKEESSFLQSLNGDWDFYYSLKDDRKGFFEKDYDVSKWDTIDVPSMWQFRGYGQCAYPNIEYPIPFNPPYVCCENPVGYYRRSFIVEEPADRTILHFGGVDNAFYVYVNGEFAGFSKGSRIPAEFDVTDKIKKGENLIAVKVFTYSDATYLENQDMLLASGIFRDVYLLHLGKNHLWDYRVTTTENSISIDAQFVCGQKQNARIRMSLDGMAVEFDLDENIKHTFELQNPKLWNAEEPNLYDLVIEILIDGKTAEIHSKRVGIIRSEVIGNRFYVNGSPVYVKGIARHEYNAKDGRSVSVEQIEEELRMIKENNLNSISGAHYMNNPAFYEIASELGIYVLEQADIETHGAAVTGDQGYLSKQPDWYDAYFDRISRMVLINKNEVCIFIWCLGNECGRGQNIDRCFEYIKEYDPSREVIQTQEEPYYPKYTKFSRTGYKSLADIKTFEETGKPLLLVEFAHAMGNSPGFLEGYWNYIYENEYMCGGYVWEFKNHGFYSEDEFGREKILYGGDFGDDEKHHWLNFCLDGLLTSNGTPKPTWYELGEAVAPVYVKFDKKLTMMNTNDFKSLGYLTLKWELQEDTKVVRCGQMPMKDILPHKSVEIGSDVIDYIPSEPMAGATYYLNLYFYDGERKIETRQIKIPVCAPKKAVAKKPFECNISTENTTLKIEMGKLMIEFSDGVISKYVNDGITLIDSPMKMNFYHANNDNDGIGNGKDFLPNWFRKRKVPWAQAFIKTMKYHNIKTEAEVKENEVVINSYGRVIPDFEWYGYETHIEYKVLASGEIITSIHCVPFGKPPEVMPRIGVYFELDKTLSKVTWYGRGKKQNYSDSKLIAPVGLYNVDISEMNFVYDVPQDTGNRENTAYVSVSNGDKNGISIVGCDEFAFSYHPYSIENIDNAKHKNELEESEKNYLYIDYKMRGLGSHSCGPEPEPEFEVYPHEFKFAFVLSALKADDEALESVRTDYGVKTEKITERYTFVEQEKQAEVADCRE